MASAHRPQVGALISAVAAMSCNGAQPTSGTQAPAAPPTVAVGPASNGSSEPLVRSVPSEPAADDGSLNARLAKLRARAEWQRFKALWREIDAAKPASGQPGWAYKRTIDAERGKDWSTRLDTQLRDLEQAKLLSADEVRFFRRVGSIRIENMQYGQMRLMTSHRAPMPFEWDRFRSVDRLEQRIDVLLELRAKGRVEQREIALALEQIEQEAVTLYVLQELQRLGRGVAPVGPRDADGASMLAELEQRIAAARAGGGAPEQPLVELVERSQAMLPTVRALFAELER